MTHQKQSRARDAAAAVEKDARGQFARPRGENSNSGVSSAAPRVLTGDEDATFANEPGDRTLGTLDGQRRSSKASKPEKPGAGRKP